MCDHDSMDDMLRYTLKDKGLSRREFGALAARRRASSPCCRAVANAAEVTESEVEIKTPDGTCDAYFVHPASGTAPACSCGRTSSACARRSGRWASGSPNRATRCSW